MELAVAAMGKVFGSLGLAGASGAGAAAATGAAAAGAGMGSGALAALSGISTVFKVLGGIGAGKAADFQAQQQAVQTELQAGQEQLQSVQRQTSMKRELLRVLGQNDVTYAAAGIDLSAGVAQDAAASATKRASEEISIDQQDTDFRRALYRMRASGQRQAGKDAKRASLVSAIGDGLNFGISLAERG